MIIKGIVNEVTRQVSFDRAHVPAVKGDIAVDGIRLEFMGLDPDNDLTEAVLYGLFELPDKSTTKILFDKTGDAPVCMFTDTITQGEAGSLKFILIAVTADKSGAVQKCWRSVCASLRMPGTIEYNNSEEEAEQETAIDRLAGLVVTLTETASTINDVKAILARLTGSSPVVVSTAAEMTDEGTIYLYNGSETGYNKGHLYYDKGRTDLGQYGAYDLDATLTKGGQAADAAAVGAETSAIKETLSDLNSTLVADLYTANKSGGGVDFTYVPADGSFNVTTETVVTNKNNAWKNLLVGASNLFGMIPGEKYYCEIEKSGEGAETVQVWWKFYQDGSQTGNSHALYDSGFIAIDEWASGIVLRIAASTNDVALNCNIKIRLERHMSNRALQDSVSDVTGKLANIQPNLNILTLGDSIALGARNGGKGFVGDLGMPYVNIGVSGASISTVRTNYKNVFTQLIDYQTANPTYKPDCIVADGGINDYISGAPMGAIPTVPAMSDTDADALDKSTLMGATGYLFYQMVKLYPRAQRYFVIVHKIKRGENSIYYPTHVRPGIDYTQEDMHDALVKICGVYGVKVIDIYKDSMLNTAFSQYVSPTPYSTDRTVTDRYFADTDGLHPLALGYKEAYIPLVKIALFGATKK